MGGDDRSLVRLATGTTVLEAGLLEARDWAGRPVGALRNENPHSDQRPPVLFRREFELPDPIARARLYATAHGLYEAELNGERVGDDMLAPGWTAYPPPAALPHLRRHRPGPLGGERARRPGSATAGTAAGSAGGGGKRNVYGTTTPSWASSR